MVKHFVLFFFSIILILGCGNRSNIQDNLLSVSIVPEKYFVEQIAGHDFDINVVIPPGTSHSNYDPSPKNMSSLGRSIGYLGIGNIGFEQSLIYKISELNPKLKIFDLSENILDPEILKMDALHKRNCQHATQDQHIWMSARKVKIIAKNIYKAVSQLKPEREPFYKENLAVFCQKMDSLDTITQQKLKDLSVRSFVIFHPALTYYAEDYQLEQIPLEVDGKDPSVAWIQQVIKLVDDKKVRLIFTQGEFSQAAATAVAEATGIELRAIDPLSEEWEKEFKSITDIIVEVMK